jgi:N-acyl homoserine lactone hydrolase
MKMHFLSGGRVRMRKSTYIPDAERSETIELPVISALLRHAQGNVLFDTGCHPSVLDDPEKRWGGLAKVMTPIMPKGDDVLTGLDAIGVQADDIDVVVCSHLHPDHCGCNVFFKRATVMVHAREVTAARAPDAVTMGFLSHEWETGQSLDLILAQRDIFGDGRIVLVSLPGHTQGSMGALLALERDGQFLLASDTVSLRSSLDTGVLPRNTWNTDALSKSWEEVRRIEARGATVICGHDDAQWRTLRKGADAYE